MSDPEFRVYALDRQVYGPVPAKTLQDWARDGRIQKDSWIHCEPGDAWRRAADLEALAAVFPEGATEPGAPQSLAAPPIGTVAGPTTSRAGVAPKVLTRLKLFSEMEPEVLDPFARKMVEESFRPFTFIVQQGSHGDAMYFVIQGKVGVSTRGQVAESFLVALNIGDTFGEMSLFDPGPRSADVRAENDVIVLKLTADALKTICHEAPAAATRFLWNVARLLSSRIRWMDRRAAAAKDMDAAGRGVR